MPSPPDAPNDPASDATSRIGDILASAEREVADIISAAERRAAEEHEARSRVLDARGSELDEREAQLAERDAALAARAAELDERSVRLQARAARVRERADELDDIGSGLVSSTIGLHEHARRLASLTPLDQDDEDAGPAPTAIRRLLGSVPVADPDPRDEPRPASPVGLHAVEASEEAEPEARDEELLEPAADDDGTDPVAEDDAPRHDVASGEPEDPRIRAAEEQTFALPALHIEPGPPRNDDDPADGAERSGDGSQDADSPDKIDSARLVALSMAAEGRPRDDVEAYIRDELKIRDHAALIDYVFGISTPSSVVPSWPPRRRRRPS